MTPKDIDELQAVGQLVGRLCLLIAVNVFACYFVPFFLAYAHEYLNGLFIPDSLRWEDGHIRKELTQFFRVSGLVIIVEWLGWLYVLYRYNRWYSSFLPYPQSLATTLLATFITGVLITASSLKWFGYFFQHL